MRQIPLQRGLVALVDDGDFGRVNRWQWLASKGTIKGVCRNYAIAIERRAGGWQRRIYLHNLVLGLPYGQRVYFRNKNTLDCRRANLLLERRRTFAAGVGKTGFRGVTTRHGKYIAVLPGRRIGRFDSAAEAAHARDNAVRALLALRGKYNFPLRGEEFALNTSGRFRGVVPAGRKFYAILPATCLGTFDTAEGAARAWDSAAREDRGSDGAYNFPLQGERSCGAFVLFQEVPS